MATSSKHKAFMFYSLQRQNRYVLCSLRSILSSFVVLQVIISSVDGILPAAFVTGRPRFSEESFERIRESRPRVAQRNEF